MRSENVLGVKRWAGGELDAVHPKGTRMRDGLKSWKA
jgi:hypothetical protein